MSEPIANTRELIIDNDGAITLIYADEDAALIEQAARPNVCRVSNVEPAPAGGWTAIMYDGTHLGTYRLRQQALDAETEYLRRELFGAGEL